LRNRNQSQRKRRTVESLKKRDETENKMIPSKHNCMECISFHCKTDAGKTEVPRKREYKMMIKYMEESSPFLVFEEGDVVIFSIHFVMKMMMICW
jgi:hypothetical protein